MAYDDPEVRRFEFSRVVGRGRLVERDGAFHVAADADPATDGLPFERCDVDGVAIAVLVDRALSDEERARLAAAPPRSLYAIVSATMPAEAGGRAGPLALTVEWDDTIDLEECVFAAALVARHRRPSDRAPGTLAVDVGGRRSHDVVLGYDGAMQHWYGEVAPPGRRHVTGATRAQPWWAVDPDGGYRHHAHPYEAIPGIEFDRCEVDGASIAVFDEPLTPAQRAHLVSARPPWLAAIVVVAGAGRKTPTEPILAVTIEWAADEVDAAACVFAAACASPALVPLDVIPTRFEVRLAGAGTLDVSAYFDWDTSTYFGAVSRSH